MAGVAVSCDAVSREDVDLLLSIGLHADATGDIKQQCISDKPDTCHNNDLCQFVPLRTNIINKHNKGGRAPNPACDSARGILLVPVYGHGVFKGMWRIDPHSLHMPPQTLATYAKFCDLIPESLVTYAVEPDIGHPWFTKVHDGKLYSLASITITVEQHLALWRHVCNTRSDVSKKQRAINRIVIKAGFGQVACRDGTGRVQFTFSREKWAKHAPSLMRGGVGCGSSHKKGRPTPVAIHDDHDGFHTVTPPTEVSP